MTRRALFAAAACACLLAAPARAGTLDSYPVVTPGASDKLCGYANATGHATQCATAQAIANLAPATPPGGASGQIQWDNGGGPLLSLTTPTTITNQNLTFVNNSAVSWLQATPSSGGGILGLTTGSLIEWANTVGFSYDSGGALDLGNGAAVGSKTGTLNLAYLNANTQISTPDGGSLTTTVNTLFQPVFIRGGGVGQTPPTMLTGSGALYIDGSSHWLISAHTMNAKGGLAIQGQVSSGCTNTTGYGFCWNSDLTLNTATGIPVASVEDQGNWFAVGIQRALPCPAQGDQGCATQGTDYVSQLILNDAVAGGSYSEPIMVIQSGDLVGGLLGIGHNAPATIGSLPTYAQNVIRLGAVQDFNTGWDDNDADQPDLGLSGGCLSLGKQNGSQSANSGGVGVTWHERLCDNAGIATFYNIARNATAPLAVSFERLTPVTVAGLATADPSPVDGDTAYVTDATAGSCVLNTPVIGLSTVHCRVHYDGSSSSWKAG